MDTNQYRISGSLTALITTCALVLGFGIGSYFHDSSETRIILIITLGCLLWGIGRARNVWMKYEAIYLEALAENRQEEHALLDKQLKVKRAAPRPTKQRYDFTSEDFDDAATSMLAKPVKKARKAKAKVTGQGLVETFLKGVK